MGATGTIEERVKDRRTLQQRLGASGVLILVGFAVVALLFLRAYQQHAVHRRHRYWNRFGDVGLIKQGDFGTEPENGTWQILRPRRWPMYVANLSATAGDYVISVRQVIGSEHAQNLYRNASSTMVWPPVQQLKISLQVMTQESIHLKPLQDFAAHLHGIDDQGRTVAMVDRGPLVAFAHGSARIFLLTDPDPHARLLRWIQGEVVVGRPNGKTKRIPFRINNVPLPVENHIFGVVYASRCVGPPPALPFYDLGGGKRLYSHAQATALRQVFAPFVPEPNPLEVPNRLLMASRAPNRFPMYVSEPATYSVRDVLHCTMTPRIDTDGEIPVEFAFGRAGSAEQVVRLRVWDNEPVVLAIPGTVAQGASYRRDTWLFWIHLYLEMPPQEHPEGALAASPIPVSSGGRGGTLAGNITVADEPVEWGRARIEIGPVDVAGHPTAEPKMCNVTLEGNGLWRLVNLAPGTYRVRILGLDPAWPLLAQVRSLDAYVKHRFGILNPAWQAGDQVVEVRSGGYTELKPSRIVEASPPSRVAGPVAAPSERSGVPDAGYRVSALFSRADASNQRR